MRHCEQGLDVVVLRREAKLHGSTEVVRTAALDRGGEGAGEVLDTEWIGVAGRLERRAFLVAVRGAGCHVPTADVVVEIATRVIGGPESEPAR